MHLNMYVAFRPYLQEFLDAAKAANFEIVLFTASEKSYADACVKLFDPEDKYFSHRLYRPACLQAYQNVYVKDLSRLGRPLERTIIVDNSVHAFGYNLDSGIPIASYYGQKPDSELHMLVS